jgi:hypothetical protein
LFEFPVVEVLAEQANIPSFCEKAKKENRLALLRCSGALHQNLLDP